MAEYQLVVRFDLECVDDAQARAHAHRLARAGWIRSAAASVKLQRLEPGMPPKGIPLGDVKIVNTGPTRASTYTWEVWCQQWDNPVTIRGRSTPESAERIVRKMRNMESKDKLYPHLPACGCIPKNKPCALWESLLVGGVTS